ncbi:hypothetical protein LCGC14_2834120 [marine sediment metagenome]|uniref:Uncharacterized protein n=1 Tax=marine sediment metagenome TaxID=412755 RepID=A0A0F8YD77_9ZZZZ
MNVVVIHRSQDGNTFEVWENPHNLGFGRVRGFRYYEKARAFAEKEALDKGLELQDNVAFAEASSAQPDERLTAEERLMRAIFGKYGKGDSG